jgi:hypothetical protein
MPPALVLLPAQSNDPSTIQAVAPCGERTKEALGMAARAFAQAAEARTAAVAALRHRTPATLLRNMSEVALFLYGNSAQGPVPALGTAESQ